MESTQLSCNTLKQFIYWAHKVLNTGSNSHIFLLHQSLIPQMDLILKKIQRIERGKHNAIHGQFGCIFWSPNAYIIFVLNKEVWSRKNRFICWNMSVYNGHFCSATPSGATGFWVPKRQHAFSADTQSANQSKGFVFVIYWGKITWMGLGWLWDAQKLVNVDLWGQLEWAQNSSKNPRMYSLRNNCTSWLTTSPNLISGTLVFFAKCQHTWLQLRIPQARVKEHSMLSLCKLSEYCTPLQSPLWDLGVKSVE